MKEPPPMPTPTHSEERMEKLWDLLALLPAKRRPAVAQALEQNDAAGLQSVTDLITHDHEVKSLISFWLVPIGMFLPFLVLAITDDAIWPCLLASLLSFGAAGLTFVLAARAFTVRRRALLDFIVLDAGYPHLDLLLESLTTQRGERRQRAIAALIPLLRGLTQNDDALLTPLRRSRLYQSLNTLRRGSETDLGLAILAAFQNTGDRGCLGAVYRCTMEKATTPAARTLQKAAQDCLEELIHRLDFGSVTQLPMHILTLQYQLQAELIDPQVYATSMLALRHLLPQLTAENYHSVLSQPRREALYRLLLFSFTPLHRDRYGTAALQEEIVRTAQRVRDTQALIALRKIDLARSGAYLSEPMRRLAQETREMLEAIAQQRKESQSLLRGASAPAPLIDELLRPAAGTALETDPAELLRAAAPRSPGSVETVTAPSEPQALLLQSQGLPAPERGSSHG